MRMAAHMRIDKAEEKLVEKILFVLIALAIAVVSCLRVPHQDSAQKILWSALALAGFVEIFASKIGHTLFGRELRVDQRGNRLLLLFFVPFALVAVYSIIYCTVTGDQIGTRTQAITTSAYILIDIFMALFLLNAYGIKALDLISIAVIFSYILTFFLAAGAVGPNNILVELQKSGQRNLFESHDVGVAVVPLLMAHCYLGFQEKMKVREFVRRKGPVLAGLAAVLILCGKRSAYLSIAIGLLTAGILYLCRRQYKIISKVICILGLLVCFLYVAGIRMGWFDFLSSGFGTLSDRYYVWKWFDQMYSISPLSLGRGFGFVHRYMLAGLGPGLVTIYHYLHNSILQIFIEAGCIGFIIWFSTYFLALPYGAQRAGGNHFSAYVIMSIAAMAAMFTLDNTLTYPVYQVSLMVSIGSVYLAGRLSVSAREGEEL